MNRIDTKFQELRAAGKTALIPFLTIGDPDLDTSVKIIRELERAGADVVELGVPYSDPLADGPVIQRASQRALRHGISIMSALQAAREARALGVEIPFVLFTYYNPVLRLGLDRLFPLLQEHEISGMIIPDLPHEENAVVLEAAREHGIHLIPLVAPTSEQRIKQIVDQASGFVYCVSSLGVTGERATFHASVDQFIQSVREATELPVAVGFGISNREQVERFARISDGVVVGSAIVRQVEETLPLLENPETREQGLLKIREFVALLRA